jgi:glycosyltransferase involved in cell wall biosynthesis
MGQGISTVSREIATNLASRGHEVFYLSPKSEADSWYSKNRLSKISIGPDIGARLGFALVVQAVKEVKPDVLINNDHPYVQAALPAIETRKLILSHAMAWSTASLVRFNHEWADSLVAISYDMLLKLMDHNVPAEKLALIMNGIEDPFDEHWTPNHNAEKKIRLAFAGNWTRIKGAELVLDSVTNAPNSLPWISLDIYGTIKKKDSVLMQRKSWVNVHGRIPREQFLTSLGEADLLIFPSMKEGCPMTIIEAMSRGVVPIVSDGKGAMRWMVTHGEDGFLARRKHWSKDFWGLLEYLNCNRDELQEMKIAARAKYIREFKIEHMIDKLEHLALKRSSLPDVAAGPYKLIKWHRPGSTKSNAHKAFETMCYKLGLLRSAGWIEKSEIKKTC